MFLGIVYQGILHPCDSINTGPFAVDVLKFVINLNVYFCVCVKRILAWEEGDVWGGSEDRVWNML